MRVIILFQLLLFSVFTNANPDTAYYSGNTEIIDSLTAKGLTIRYWVNKKSGEKDGLYTMIYKNKVLMKGMFEQGYRQGTWEFYRMNDTIQTKGNYQKGKKDGVWKSYYSNGKLSCEINYENGMRQDTSTGYYKNGQISFQKNYQKDTLIGEAKHYYPKGNVWYIEMYQNGRRNGNSKKYYENGTIKEEAIHKDGKRDSIYKFYYDDGTLWEHIIYRNGGIWNVIAYNDAKGNPINCCTIKDGNGIMRFYDKDGKITDEYEYKNLEKNGITKYYKKGILESEGNYIQNERSGMWKSYYESGEVYSEINYVDGEKNGVATFYKNGKIYNKGIYINGSREGVWKTFDENEKISSENTYKENKLHGECKNYNNGIISSEGQYAYGAKTGTWIYYTKKGAADYSVNYPGHDELDYGGSDYGPNNSAIKEESDVEIFHIVEEMPSFPGGEKEMMEFIRKNISYPAKAIEEGIQGTVYVTFVVSATGEIRDAKIIRGVYPSLDKEAVKIIRSMPIWSPGMQQGQTVWVQFNIPIKFSLK